MPEILYRGEPFGPFKDGERYGVADHKDWRNVTGYNGTQYVAPEGSGFAPSHVEAVDTDGTSLRKGGIYYVQDVSALRGVYGPELKIDPDGWFLASRFKPYNGGDARSAPQHDAAEHWTLTVRRGSTIERTYPTKPDVEITPSGALVVTHGNDVEGWTQWTTFHIRATSA